MSTISYLLPALIFSIGLLGFMLNRRHLIIMILNLELIILASTLLIILSGLENNDTISILFSIYIIALTGSETAIALGIIIAYYRVRGNIGL